MLDIDLQSWIYFLAWYPVILRRKWVLSCVIPCRWFRLLLVSIYAKYEPCINFYGKQIVLDCCHSNGVQGQSTFILYLVQKFTFDLQSLYLEHQYYKKFIRGSFISSPLRHLRDHKFKQVSRHIECICGKILKQHLITFSPIIIPLMKLVPC